MKLSDHLVVAAAQPRSRQVESQLRPDGPVASQVLAVNEDHTFTPTLPTAAAMRRRRIKPQKKIKNIYIYIYIIIP